MSGHRITRSIMGECARLRPDIVTFVKNLEPTTCPLTTVGTLLQSGSRRSKRKQAGFGSGGDLLVLRGLGI